MFNPSEAPASLLTVYDLQVYVGKTLVELGESHGHLSLQVVLAMLALLVGVRVSEVEDVMLPSLLLIWQDLTTYLARRKYQVSVESSSHCDKLMHISCFEISAV